MGLHVVFWLPLFFWPLKDFVFSFVQEDNSRAHILNFYNYFIGFVFVSIMHACYILCQINGCTLEHWVEHMAAAV